MSLIPFAPFSGDDVEIGKIGAVFETSRRAGAWHRRIVFELEDLDVSLGPGGPQMSIINATPGALALLPSLACYFKLTARAMVGVAKSC